MEQQFGLAGLGVMGRNLALNAAGHGFNVVATDSWESARAWSADDVTVTADQAELAARMAPPRRILLMVKAGAQVDAEIAGLSPHLAPGDLIIDGGNSRFQDAGRRGAALAETGILYLGAGNSGGGEGARNGPAIMVGGDTAAWELARPILTKLGARATDGTTAVDYFGPGGAGHFVKMVHNGIECAIMQAIAECHGVLHRLAGLDHDRSAAIFAEWADGRPGGYLTEITAEILAVRDADTGGYLLDRISDVAGQKGTGSWTVEAALAYGVPIPTIMEAVAARQLSGHRAGRRTVQGDSAPASEAPQSLIDDLETALLASMAASLRQGLDLYAVAAAEHHWQPDLTSLLKVWRAGSILRCRQLEVMIEAISDGTSCLPSSLMPGWRRAVGAAISAALPVPALAASLGYADALSAEVLPTALIQAQRDRFGDHGFRRTDRPGTHHGPWSDGNDISGR